MCFAGGVPPGEPEAPELSGRVRGPPQLEGLDTIGQMGRLAAGMMGKRLTYRELVVR